LREKALITLCGELAFEAVVELSSDNSLMMMMTATATTTLHIHAVSG